MKLFFASSNRNKIEELQGILKREQLPLQLVTLLDYPKWEIEVEESGKTYEENALLKAQAYQKLTDLPILTDDSGLEVDVFPGLLGVHTNRWHPGDANEKNLALLKKLGPEKNRACHYNCTLCLLEKGREPIFFTGICGGKIASQASQAHGFGYDPIFIPNGYKKTFATLGKNVKNKISHRRQAIDQLSDFLHQQKIAKNLKQKTESPSPKNSTVKQKI